MGYFGTFKNKKEVESVLKAGCDYLQSILNDYDGETEEEVIRELDKLRKVLCEEGRYMLSITNQVKYEEKINNLEKKLLKMFQNI